MRKRLRIFISSPGDVWAISEGRQAARGVDEFLMGRSDLGPALKLF